MRKIVDKNVLLFIAGYCVYIAIEVTFRGYSYPLMGICGGLLVVLIDKINDRISWNTDILIQGAIGSALITSFELIIGELSLHSILPMMWDYSNLPFNYKGIICLPFSLLWFGLSIVDIFLADSINYYVFNTQPRPYYKLLGKIILQFPER